MDYTAEEFSKKLGVEKDRGYGFLRFLEAAGLAETAGTKLAEGRTKGKGALLYRVKPGAAEKLKEMLGGL